MIMTAENTPEKTKRAKKIISRLKKHYPTAKCSLHYKTVHQLMVATILSAQCTDERVNKITPTLFKKYPSIKAFADADVNELAQDIFTAGFHNAKAKAIKKSAQQLWELYNGKIPKQLKQLVKLAGVGRKTASVILGAGYNLAEGIVVDTHVGRISRRLGLTPAKNPIKVEKDLIEIIPKKDWINYAYLMIDHGRTICKARKPDCQHCFLKGLCPFPTLKK
ncbi:MAG: endonuclease III [FCB group bacterium]|nr:endonuclease III [FCB group bacterium]